MGYLKTNWRRAAFVFGGCTLVSFIFASVSYAAAAGENNKEFDFVSALRLNLVQFYLWAILSPLIFRFSLSAEDRKSTRLNSSHLVISYAVFCLKKKKKNKYLATIFTLFTSSN